MKTKIKETYRNILDNSKILDKDDSSTWTTNERFSIVWSFEFIDKKLISYQYCHCQVEKTINSIKSLKDILYNINNSFSSLAIDCEC
jgi:hypothetical protein